MVVNEVTCSVQAKGTKTVIATAVALVAGFTVAAPEISTTPDVHTDRLRMGRSAGRRRHHDRQEDRLGRRQG